MRYSTTNSFGFTLLELLAVLLILSLLAGMVAPRLSKMYESVQIAFERDEVLAQLNGLNYLAFQQSQDFVLTRFPVEKGANDNLESAEKLEKEAITNELPLELPEGWQIRADTPIFFRANGACSGGMVYLQFQERSFRVQLKPPFCDQKLLSSEP
jgi:general secretion pathway protein G